MALPGFFLNKYAPLDLPQPLSAMPRDYPKHLPRFNREDDNTAQIHIETFSSFSENINVEHLDVVMGLFVQSLDGEARKCFKSLPNASIDIWEQLENSFTQKWGEKMNHEYLLTKFNAIRKNPKEDTIEFIKRFNKQFSNLPANIKPPSATTCVFFLGAFDSDVGINLREMKSTTLDQLQIDSLEVEVNLASVGSREQSKNLLNPKLEKRRHPPLVNLGNHHTQSGNI